MCVGGPRGVCLKFVGGVVFVLEREGRGLDRSLERTWRELLDCWDYDLTVH